MSRRTAMPVHRGEPLARGRWAIYVRISDDGKVKGGHGVKRQAELIRQRLMSRGIAAADLELYEDNDKSATNGKPRPEYLRMCADIQAGHIVGVGMFMVDRWLRMPKELEAFIDLMEEREIDFEVISGALNLSTANGRMLARISVAVANHETEIKQERQLAETGERARRGGRSGGPRGYGYSVPRKSTGEPITIIESEATIIREVVARILGGESTVRITRELNARGVRTSKGSTWGTSTLLMLAVSARISGRREYLSSADRDKRKGIAKYIGEIMCDKTEYPAIISAADSDAVRAMFRDGRRAAAWSYARKLMSGKLRCGKCGHPMNARPQRGTPGYQCIARLNGRGCGTLSINAERVDAFVWGAIERALTSPDFAARLRKATKVPAGLIESIHADEERMREVRADRDNGVISRKQELESMERINARLVKSRAQLERSDRARALAFALVPADEIAKACANRTVSQRRAAIDAFLDHIVVMPEKGRGRAVDKRLCEPVWLM